LFEAQSRSILGHCVHARKSNRAFIGQSLSVLGCDKIFVHACTRPSNAPGWRLRACMHAKNREEGMKKSNRCAFLHIVVTVYRSHQDLPQTSTESGIAPRAAAPGRDCHPRVPSRDLHAFRGLLGTTARCRAAEPPLLSHSHQPCRRRVLPAAHPPIPTFLPPRSSARRPVAARGRSGKVPATRSRKQASAVSRSNVNPRCYAYASLFPRSCDRPQLSLAPRSGTCTFSTVALSAPPPLPRAASGLDAAARWIQ
jgi:hypothetical protein